MNYYIQKVAGLLVTLLLVSFITFSVFQILPGNPAYIILGVDADPMQIEALNKSMGLDKPALVRYVDWIAGLFRGDLGVSYRYQQPVAQLISDALEVTGSLAIITLILTLIIGVLAGVWLADHSDKWYSLPLSMPSCSLALGTSAIVIRYVKVSVNGQRKQDYVRTAYSKGLGKNKVMYRHVLRNSLIPVITIFGMTAADILGGSIIVENVFSMPGIGRLISVSISSRDLPLLQGLTFYLALIVVVCNFAVDLIYSLVDPRIRLK